MIPPSSDLRATRIFTDALELPSEERPRFLDQACAGNPDLRAKVEALLGAYPQAESLFRQLGAAANAVAGKVAREDLRSAPMPTSDQTEEMPRTAGGTNRIGRYRILEKIGEGGFGEVFIADQIEPVRRRVALKILKAGMDTKSVLARFEAERQALALMDHPNIAKVLDAGETEQGRPYFVMDLVQGEPITAYCDRHTLSTKERLELFMPVCRAVQHAHQKGIIHRDIKPSNVLVTLTDSKPTPKVIDFGIAKATSASLTDKTLHTMQGQLIGTPAYMSPEQAEVGGLDVDTRTDIYSLGVVLYELLAGSLPFDPETLRKAGYAEMQRILRHQDPPKPSTKVTSLGEQSKEVAKRRHTDVRTLRRQLRGELDWITLKAMEKDRTRRYETPNSLAMDIRRYLADEPVLAGPPSAAYRARKFAKRNKVTLGVATGILLTVTGALIQSNIQRVRIQAARDESEAVTGFLTGMLSSVSPSAQGRDVTVREVLDEAAKTLGEKFKAQPLIEARVRHTIGRVYRSLGEYEAADTQLERVVEIQRRELGEEHVETLRSMFFLALSIGEQGRSDECEARLLGVLATQRRVLGDEHVETINTMGLLAFVYRDQARYAEAESLLVRTLAARRRMLGEEDLNTLALMNALATVHGLQGRTAEAAQLLQTIQPMMSRVLGEEDPLTLNSRSYLAQIHEAQERYPEAESLGVKTLETERRVLGDEHPMTLNTITMLARIQLQRGRYEEAESLIVQVAETHRRVRGEGSRYRTDAMQILAAIQNAQGRDREARSLLEEVLQIQRGQLGRGHPQTLGVIYQLAEIHDALGRYAEAESLYAEALEGWRRVAVGDTVLAMNALANLCKNQRRLDASEAFLRQVLSGPPPVGGPYHAPVLRTMSLLIDLYRSTGRDAEADSLVVERLALHRAAAARPEANASVKGACARELLTCELLELRAPEEALRLALAANELTGFRNAGYLDTLALAYQLTGRTTMAIETQQKAIALLVEETPRSPLIEEFENRLAEYRATAAEVP